MSTLMFSDDDLRQIVQRVGIDVIMDELVQRLFDALAAFDPQVTEIPTRAGFHYDTPVTGLIEWMPLLEKQRSVVMKVVGYHPDSPETLQLPTILSNLSKYDPSTGRLVALMDGTFLTAMRTGAASAVASRVLADPDSSTIGLIGCGAQAVTQLHALSRCFDLNSVLIYDVDQRAMDSFTQRIRAFAPRSLPIRQESLAELVAASDILCVATSVGIGEGPVFDFTDVRPALHVNAVGSDFPGKTEVPKALLLDSFVCADTRDQAMREGECQQLSADQVAADLPEVVKQAARFERFRSHKTVFDSTGWALEDQVAMDLMLELAGDLGIGTEVHIECVSEDPRDPYEFIDAGSEQSAVDDKASVTGGV